MQALGGNTLSFRTCLNSIRTVVMGCCYSLCSKESDTQEGCVNERTRLLVEPVREEEAAPLRATQPAVSTPRKPDEQSALNRILQETATNVIDVGALGPHALEPHEYNERVRAYQGRMGAGVSSVVPPHPKLLKDIMQAEKLAVLSTEPIVQVDWELITNAVKNAASAMSDLKVDHREDLVVPFRIP